MFITILNVLLFVPAISFRSYIHRNRHKNTHRYVDRWILQHCLSPSKTGNEMLIDREVVEPYSKTILWKAAIRRMKVAAYTLDKEYVCALLLRTRACYLLICIYDPTFFQNQCLYLYVSMFNFVCMLLICFF